MKKKKNNIFFNTYEEFLAHVTKNYVISVEKNTDFSVSNVELSDYVYDKHITGGSRINNWLSLDDEDYECEIDSELPSYENIYDLCQLLYEKYSTTRVEEEYDLIKQEYMLDIDITDNSDYYGSVTYYEYHIVDLKKYYKDKLSLKAQRKLKLKEINA